MDSQFSIQLLHGKEGNCILPLYLNESEICFDKEVIPQIKEYESLSFKFESKNGNDRLYLPELDDFSIANKKEDTNGKYYFLPSERLNIIYGFEEGNTVPLIPGYYYFHVISEGVWYYSAFEVILKDLTTIEWQEMRLEIEKSLSGLSIDFINKNKADKKILKKANIESNSFIDKIDFLLENSSKIKMILSKLIAEANFKIQKEYFWVPKGKKALVDSTTIKLSQLRPEMKNYTYSPRRRLKYDVPENQWIKYILEYLYKGSTQSINYLKRMEETVNESFVKNKKYLGKDSRFLTEESKLITQIKSLRLQQQKLRDFNSYLELILNHSFFSKIKSSKFQTVPKSLVLSTKYNYIYKTYLSLINNHIPISFSKEYIYFWKKTDLLYEIWIYLKVIEALRLSSYEVESGWIFDMKNKNEEIPFLMDGTVVSFRKENILLKVRFNEPIPRDTFTNNLESPVKTASHRNKPDIRVDVYSDGKFAGCVVIEVKYVRLHNILQGSNKEKILEQLRSYKNNIFSTVFDVPEIVKKQSQVVHSVIVTYPKSNYDLKRKREFIKEEGIIFNELRPNFGLKEFTECINKEIKETIEYYEFVNVSRKSHA